MWGNKNHNGSNTYNYIYVIRLTLGLKTVTFRI